MNSLYLDLDQGIKQEQYKDLLRKAGNYRLVKAVAQPGPNQLQKVALALHKAMVGLAQHLPSHKPMNRAQV